MELILRDRVGREHRVCADDAPAVYYAEQSAWYSAGVQTQGQRDLALPWLGHKRNAKTERKKFVRDYQVNADTWVYRQA
jgi:hypothetical protein